MFWNLLTSSTDNGGKGGDNSGLIFIGVMAVLFVLFIWWSRRSQKKREKEINDTLNAIQPGNKVKTIGGICGVVVEVCPEDDTLIVETGSENSGKSYIKFDKKAIYQTDAKKPEVVEAPVEEQPVFEETVEETPVEETVEVVEETPVEETQAEEIVETPVEE